MNLIPRVVFGDLDLTDYPYSILMDEGDDGVAQNAYQSIDTELRDGTIIARTHTENREVSRVVMVEGTDLLEVAESTAALARECEKSLNTLTLDPGDGYGPPKVYETFTAQIAEVALPGGDNANVRLFRVTWPALPFARSVDPFTVTGVTSTGTTTTTVNDASSTTGWSAQNASGSPYTPTGTGTEITVEARADTTGGWVPPTLIYTPASPVDMAGLPYLKVRWRMEGVLPSSTSSFYAYADGVSLTQVTTAYVGGYGSGGYFETTFNCPDVSVSQFKFTTPKATSAGSSFFGTFNLDNLAKSNIAPVVGTSRQKVTSVEVPGSARTPASLSVSHASSALGDVVVYTSPALRAGYAPPVSPWATAAGTTQAGRVSGKFWSLSSGERFDVPASMLPRGAYQIVARVVDQSSTAGFETITTTVATRLNGTDMAPQQKVVTKHPSTSLSTSTYTNVVLGSFQVPPADVPDASSALVRVTIQGAVNMDEAWLFYLPDDGSSHLSLVPCGTGTPAAGSASNRLFLNAATVDNPFPSCFVGTLADQSDSRAASGASANWTEHLFPAGENLVFVVTAAAEDAQVSVEGFARWHTHPAS